MIMTFSCSSEYLYNKQESHCTAGCPPKAKEYPKPSDAEYTGPPTISYHRQYCKSVQTDHYWNSSSNIPSSSTNHPLHSPTSDHSSSNSLYTLLVSH